MTNYEQMLSQAAEKYATDELYLKVSKTSMWTNPKDMTIITFDAYDIGRAFINGASWEKNRMSESYQKLKRHLACAFMDYLDNYRRLGKMCLSNMECEDIDKAFDEKDWDKLARYAKKYLEEPAKPQDNGQDK